MPVKNIIQKSVTEIGYSQPEKETRTPFGYFSIVLLVAVQNDYVKVKGDKSPFDGNLIYWSTRMGRHPEMPNSKAIRLKKQKGKCNWCGLHLSEGDVP